jgi:hypothetical protein
MSTKKIVTTLTSTFLFVAVCSLSATAQTTNFTYQGKLSAGASPANGNFDFEFRLYDLLSGGTQQGSTLTLTNVPVSNGIFTVQLDFVACGTCVPCPTCFNGSSRFLDITVRPTGGGSFTPLTPRQSVTSNPFAIRSLNAASADSLSLACVNCVTSGQIGSVDGSSVTGTIPVTSLPPGSDSYIRNSTTLQSQSAFYVASGHVSAGVRIEGSGFNTPDTPSLSLSATGSLQVDAPFLPGGRFTILENGNVGIGNGAPNQKLEVAGDAKFTGNQTITGNLGIGAISPGSRFNVTGSGIVRARINSDSNGGISFALSDAAKWSLASVAPNGDFLLFNDATSTLAFQVSAVTSRMGIGTGSPSSRLHVFDSSNTGLRVQNNLAGGTVGSFGFKGAFNIDSNANAGGRFSVLENGNVGIGVPNPLQLLSLSGTGIVRTSLNSDTNAGYALSLADQQKWSLMTLTGGNFQLLNDGLTQTALIVSGSTNNIGIGTVPTSAKLTINASGTTNGLAVSVAPGNIVAGFGSNGEFQIDDATTPGGRFKVTEGSTVQINNPQGPLTDNVDRLIINGYIRANFASGGGTLPLCLSSSQQIARCLTSSIRYKENISDFTPGLDLALRLRPVRFDWKTDHNHDLGLVAEEVAKIEPLLAVYENGQIEGVKYDRVAVVLLNAVREQQDQIKKQFDLIQKQQRELNAQKRLLRNEVLQLASLKRVVHPRKSYLRKRH